MNLPDPGGGGELTPSQISHAVHDYVQSLYPLSLSLPPILSLSQERSQNVTSRQPDFDQVLGDGQNLLAVAHPKAVPILQSKLQRLERKWMELRGHIGEL